MGYKRFTKAKKIEAAQNQAMAQHEEGWVCPHCELTRGPDLYDPCFGELLPGVKYACCGHGGLSLASPEGYIAFENGTVVYFTKLTKVVR